MENGTVFQMYEAILPFVDDVCTQYILHSKYVQLTVMRTPKNINEIISSLVSLHSFAHLPIYDIQAVQLP